jgi:hypothetical protein
MYIPITLDTEGNSFLRLFPLEQKSNPDFDTELIKVISKNRLAVKE